MERTRQGMLSNALKWMTEKWKLAAGFAVFVATALVMYLRSKNQKKVLDMANKSHDKENKVNKKAFDDLSRGLEKISKNEKSEIDASKKSHKKAEKALAAKKEDFIEDSKENKNLAKDLADKIGADFVDLNKK